MNFRVPPALAAAELPVYEARYGLSVRAMDRVIGEVSAPPELIDLTHGDTRAFTPPASAKEDVLAAITDNSEAYSPYRGSNGLRTLLSPRIGELLEREVDPDRELILTPGTQGGLFTSLSALVSPGDAVALPALEYFMDERIGAYLGALLVRVDVEYSAQGLMSVSEDALEAASRAGVCGLVLSHPNNPTGAIYDQSSLHRMADWAIANDLWVVADQLYCRLIFDGRTYGHIGSLPRMIERTVTLLGPSKTESMSGYRVGVAVGPPPVIDAIEQVVSMTSLRTAGYAQHTLRHWMEGDETWLKERIVAHEALRDELIIGLRAIPGMMVKASAGSSYVFPDISGTEWGCAHDGDDFAFARAAKSAGVLISPGYQFGPAGRGHFRINFSQNAGRLRHSVEIIDSVLRVE